MSRSFPLHTCAEAHSRNLPWQRPRACHQLQRIAISSLVPSFGPEEFHEARPSSTLDNAPSRAFETQWQNKEARRFARPTSFASEPLPRIRSRNRSVVIIPRTRLVAAGPSYSPRLETQWIRRVAACLEDIARVPRQDLHNLEHRGHDYEMLKVGDQDRLPASGRPWLPLYEQAVYFASFGGERAHGQFSGFRRPSHNPFMQQILVHKRGFI